jgi:hypothetical protein
MRASDSALAFVIKEATASIDINGIAASNHVNQRQVQYRIIGKYSIELSQDKPLNRNSGAERITV